MAVDSTGQTIDFLLTDRPDTAAAKRFFRRALLNEGNSMPRVINVDKLPAYPRAFEDLKREGAMSRRCRLRQCKLLEQCGGERPSQSEAPNVAGERLWFDGHGMADVARNRGDGHGEEVDRQGRSRWPSEVQGQSCSLRNRLSITHSLRRPIFATETLFRYLHSRR
jgi:hypothetical protein